MTRIAFARLAGQLADAILTEVEEGRRGAGQKMESERALALRFGVSRVTVRRALDRLARDGVIERRGARGTFVRRGGRRSDGASSARREVRRFALCFLNVYDVTHPYFARLIRALTDLAARESRAFALHTFTSGDIYYRRPCPLVDALAGGGLDGLLLAGRMKLEDLLALRRARVPFVWVNQRTSGEDIPTALVDYAAGAFAAVEHLLALGHERIGLLLGTPVNRASYLSKTGYQLALRAGGVAWDEGLVRSSHFDSRSGYALARDLLASKDPPTAIFAVDDLIACGVLKAAREMGLHVPEGLSVVGCGDFVSPFDTTPALTTLDILMEELAAAALRLLDGIAAGGVGRLSDVTIEPKLVVRESTARARKRERP